MSDNLTFLSGTNAEYIAHLYSVYLRDKGQVDASWRSFFDGLDDREVSLLRELHGASWTPQENRKDGNSFGYTPVSMADEPETAPVVTNGNGHAAPDDVRKATNDSISALMLIRAYRARGHLVADLDPLHLKDKPEHPELDPSHYGFGPSDMDRPIYIGGVLGMETATVREILAALQETYCGTIGVEFMHLTDRAAIGLL